jgi:holo-[acyl-carrier protein] synthase
VDAAAIRSMSRHLCGDRDPSGVRDGSSVWEGRRGREGRSESGRYAGLMIVGIGVDLVDIPRFERLVERTPRLLERLFSDAERKLKLHSLAARYAAKEALIKALGDSDGLHWTEIEIASEPSGKPVFALSGQTAVVVADRGIHALHLSLSHDAGLATAYVIAERLEGIHA